MPDPAPASRNQALDVLRCLAVLLVLGHHFPHYTLWSRAGWIGVDLFFVLSGFLISGLLFQEYKATGHIGLWRFWARRALKIWPPFYAFLGTVAVIFLLSAYTFPSREFISTSAFLQMYLTPNSQLVTIGALCHLWSLAVEEHFYIALPLILAALQSSRRRFDRIPAFFAAAAVISLILRILTLRSGQWAWMTHLRMDGLFAGVFLGYLYHFRRVTFEKFDRPWSPVIAAAACLPCLLLPGNSLLIQTFGLSALWVGFSSLVAWAVKRRPSNWFFVRAAAWLGFHSYSIYLWHMLLVPRFESLGSSALAFWFAILFSIVFGVLLIVFPGAGALALVWLIGSYSIVFGVMMLLLAFRLRSHHQQAGSTLTGTSANNPLR